MRLRSALFAASGLAACTLMTAHAEVTAASADGFQINLEKTSKLSMDDVFRKIGNLPEWWSASHTYSGNAENLSLSKLEVGGVWVESSKGISVEHGRVIAVLEQETSRLVRFDAALGPLQELGVKGVLSVRITPETDIDTEDQSKVSFGYYVTGADFQSLDKWASTVEGVLATQLDNLVASETP